MQLPDGGFHASAQPGKPCIRPTSAYMKHKNVLPALAIHKSSKRVAPEKDSILERQCHGGAFIGKAAMLEFDLIEKLRQCALITMLKSRVVALKEDPPNIFQAALNLRARRREATPGKFNFLFVDFQELLQR
jgi:hypothetical protein